MIQLTLTLKMPIQIVKTSVTLNNSPIQDYLHLDNHTLPTYENLYILYHNILYIYTLDIPVPLTL